MQQKGQLSRAAQTLLYSLFFPGGYKLHDLLDSRGKALARSVLVRMMNQPCAQIALIGGVALDQLFRVLGEFIEVPLCRAVVEPRQP